MAWQAADFNFCDQYARKSVQQQVAENSQLPLDKARELGFDRIVRVLRNRGAKTMAECLAAR